MPKVRTITIDELARIGIDENNQLYWDERPLVTEERIVLAHWVNAALILGLHVRARRAGGVAVPRIRC